MSVDLVEINGKSRYLDYQYFEKTLKEEIGRTCSDAKVFVFNDFPVAVSAEHGIDFVFEIAVNPKNGNYYRLWKNDKWVYLHNLILPIKVVSYLTEEDLLVEETQIICNDEYVDYSTEINSLRFGFIDYLSSKCNFVKSELYVHPIIFIENKIERVFENYIIASKMDFNILRKYLLESSLSIFLAYKRWNTDSGYKSISSDIELVTNKASKDSEIGYLTKKKIERIGKQLSSSKKIFEDLNKWLVIIEGKPGTGKSSELLLLNMRCISDGKNTLFLTYNKLLVFDIAKTVKSFVNSRLNTNTQVRPGEGSVLTLHAFFFRLSHSLGVLHVLSEKRIDKLLDVLKQRMRLVYDFILNWGDVCRMNLENLKTGIQNASNLDIGAKEVGIDFVNFLKNSARIGSIADFENRSIEFFEHKKKLLFTIGVKEVFLADYYGVLENTLLVIRDSSLFFEKYNIEDKFDLLQDVLDLKEKHLGGIEGERKILAEAFLEKKNRKVGGHRRKRTLFVDEAQDCHRLEKEILISIFGSENIVVANGGKEQLIRHVELCDWGVFQNRNISIRKHPMRNKSYRVKKTVLDFCNFVANKYQVDLKLEPLESEDEGEVIVDFRQTHSKEEIIELFNSLILKAEVNGCTPYEGLLILLDSSTQRERERNNKDGRGNRVDIGTINEYENIERSNRQYRSKWEHIDSLRNHGFSLWDGTVADKNHLIIPGPLESRVIFYESCRGLESWSVACFAIDSFFQQKRLDDDAEKYLIGDLFLNQDNEKRKSMYAATWALMALTRVIDTLYIQINDKNSEFGRVILEYLELNSKKIKVLN